jgi:hypothetical protein
MEVGQGPKVGCSAKGKMGCDAYVAVFTIWFDCGLGFYDRCPYTDTSSPVLCSGILSQTANTTVIP